MTETPFRKTAATAALALAAGAVMLSGCLTQRAKAPPSYAIQQMRAEHRAGPAALACADLPVGPVFVGFGFDDAVITELEQTDLAAALAWTACHRDGAIVIQPASDHHGTEAEQHALAQHRAEAVAAYLKAHGVSNAITILPEGAAEPAGAHLLIQAWGRRW